MVEHIVLFKWKEGTSPDTIDSIINALKGMKGKIPEIVDLTCGENFTQRSQGFTHGLVVRFLDRAGLETYQIHPIHQEIVQSQIKPVALDILALDYEF